MGKSITICWCIFYDCFSKATENLSGYDRYHIVPKAQHIYYLVFHRKKVANSFISHFPNLGDHGFITILSKSKYRNLQNTWHSNHPQFGCNPNDLARCFTIWKLSCFPNIYFPFLVPFSSFHLKFSLLIPLVLAGSAQFNTHSLNVIYVTKVTLSTEPR